MDKMDKEIKAYIKQTAFQTKFIEYLYKQLQEYFEIYSQNNALTYAQKSEITHLLQMLSDLHSDLISDFERRARGIGDQRSKRVIRLWKIRDWWSVASISNDIVGLFDPIPSIKDILFNIGDLTFDKLEDHIWREIKNEQEQFQRELNKWLVEQDSLY